MSKKPLVGILGYGEVGKTVSKFYNKPRIKDIKRDDNLSGVEILHICIPWSNRFIRIVQKEIKQINPNLCIINSTVAPGATKQIGGMVVHSPIRGTHPNLYKSVKTFVKYIGADSEKPGNLAKQHFSSLGIKSKIFYPSAATEIGKLLSTSYYGLCIAWHGEMKEICDKHRVNFKDVVSDFNKTYNQGYKLLGRDNVIRPVLLPPDDFIGGHCIVKNAEILNKFYKSKALDLILKYKKH